MMSIMALWFVVHTVCGALSPQAAGRTLMYLAMTDRFHDGRSDNNGLAGAQGGAVCFNRSNPEKFHGGDFVGMGEKVDYLVDLGIGTIWITPWFKQGTYVKPDTNVTLCHYHGYYAELNRNFDTTPEPSFGTVADLRQLLTKLHDSGLKVVMDVVLNHAAFTSDVYQAHLRAVNNSSSTNAGDWFRSVPECDYRSVDKGMIDCAIFSYMPDFIQETPAVAVYLRGLVAAWLAAYDFDALRVDTVKHVRDEFFEAHFFPVVRALSVDWSSNWVVAEIYNYDARSYVDYCTCNVSAPALSANPRCTHGEFDGVLNFAFYGALIGTVAQGASTNELARTVADVVQRLGLVATVRSGVFLDNHDLWRFVDQVAAAAPSTHTQHDLRERLFAALTLLVTLPGIPILYYGTELGMRGRTDPDNRRDMPPWAWTSAQRVAAQAAGLVAPLEFVADPDRTFRHTQRCAALRRAIPALGDGGRYVELWRQGLTPGAPDVFVFLRSDALSSRAVVFFNNERYAVRFVAPVLGGRNDYTAATASDQLLFATDGVVLVNRQTSCTNGCGPSVAVTTDGLLPFSRFPPKEVGVYTPRLERDPMATLCRVTFQIVADPAWLAATPGTAFYLVGSLPELGLAEVLLSGETVVRWQTERGVRLREGPGCGGAGTGCGYSVTIRHLSRGLLGVQWKPVIRSVAAPTTTAPSLLWQRGANLVCSWGDTATATCDGGVFVAEGSPAVTFAIVAPANERYVLTGSHVALGTWNPAQGIPMKLEDGLCQGWCSFVSAYAVRFPRSAGPIEWKPTRLTGNQGYAWQTGDNNRCSWADNDTSRRCTGATTQIYF